MATAYSWVFYPRPGLRTIEASSTAGTNFLDATGIKTDYGGGCKFTLTDQNIFKQRTVFLFYGQFYKTISLLRSEDNAFRIGWSGTTTANTTLSCSWKPETLTAADEEELGTITVTSSANSFVGGNTATTWIAVEVDPSTDSTAQNLFLYNWDSAGTAWDQITDTSTTTAGSGILSPESNTWYLAESYDGECQLEDFRVIVGDDDWKTNNTEGTITNPITSNIVTWFNHATGYGYPRDENISTRSMPESGDLVAPIIAMSDRIDGELRYKAIPHVAFGWTGCPYLKGGFLPRVEDVYDAESGSVSGSTDAYYFEDTTPYLQLYSKTKSTNKVANVGSHKYIVGPSPFQVVGRQTRQVGPHIPYMYTQGSSASFALSTIDDDGSLEYDTTYKFYVTIYDPTTGNESNPVGYWRFTTDSNPGSSSGCAFSVITHLVTFQNIIGLEMRYYRYASGTGEYHLEGSSKLTGWYVHATEDNFRLKSFFKFAMSDDNLILQKELEWDNDAPPEHTHSTIWGNRSWFVDAINPSRMYYSKPLQLGAVPPANLIWTDEGITGKILGTLQGFGGLILLKERSLWIVPPFEDDAGALAQPLVPDLGCVSGDAAVFANGLLWWASSGGIYMFDGETTQALSDRLDDDDKLVWDHNPRACKAWHESINKKIVFSCDGSGISIDTRSLAIAKVAAVQTCYSEISSSAYSGPIWGGDGMVWREAVGNASLTLDTNEKPSGDYDDEFGSTTQQNLASATDGEVDYGWNVRTANADIFDVNSTKTGYLSIRPTYTAANSWITTAATGEGPFLYRATKGGFSLETSYAGNSEADYFGCGMAAQDSGTPKSWVGFRFEAIATAGSIRTRCVNNFDGCTASDWPLATINSGATLVKLVRTADTFLWYTKATEDADWDLERTEEIPRMPDEVNVGLFAEDFSLSAVGMVTHCFDYFRETSKELNTFGPEDADYEATVDAFGAGTEQTITAIDGPKLHGWYLSNAANLGAIDVHTTNAGSLTLTNKTGTAYDWSESAQDSAFFYRKRTGDLDISTEWEDSALAEDGCKLLFLVNDPTTANNWIGWEWNQPSGSAFCMAVSVEGGTRTETALSTVNNFVRIERDGDEFNLYSKAASTDLWKCRYTVTRSDIPNETRVGFTAASDTAVSARAHTFAAIEDSTQFSTDGCSWDWYNGEDTGTEVMGYKYDPLSSGRNTWLECGTPVGRNFTQWSASSGDCWAAMIHNVTEGGRFFVRSSQPNLDEFFIDRHPVYYESQKAISRRRADGKIFNRIDFTTGEEGDTAEAFCSFNTQIYGESSISVSASATLTPETTFTLPARTRGNTHWYIYKSWAPQDIPDIRLVRTHFRTIRPRGRAR